MSALPHRLGTDDDGPQWPAQWWCNHTKRPRFGPPFYECELCAALSGPFARKKPEPKPPRFPLHWLILAAIVATAVATAAVGLA